jgi:competence protein ComEC
LKDIFKNIFVFSKFLDDNFFNDYYNWILWVPFLFFVGILLFFRLDFYNSKLLLIFVLIIPIIFFSKSKKNQLLLISICFILFGYFRCAFYIQKIKTPTINYKMGIVDIYGVVEDLSYFQKNDKSNRRILVKIEKIIKNKNLNMDFSENGELKKIPKYIRINLKETENFKINFGDFIKISANLIPIPKQNFKWAYNPKQAFYFQEIGGIGYNGKIIELTKPQKTTLRYKIYNIRENINNRIIDIVGEKNGSIIGSFITGIRGRTLNEDSNNIMYAGLTHLIAISGLNMSLVIGFAYLIIRRLISENSYLTLKYDIKKFSAIFAILFGLFYLNITGFPISAVRAYIMSTLFFIGIILDKEGDIMRFSCFTAFIILLNEPSLILNAGFQLSFIAVIGLIAGFKWLREHGIILHSNNIWLKIIFSVYFTILSTLIAEIATLPLTIFHFNLYNPYNIFTNAIAIPLTEIITLPFSMLSVLFMPFHLEKYFLIPASWSIDIILNISKYAVELPYSIHIISSPSIIGLCFMIFGFFWFCLWEEKWRYFGIILFFIGILISPFKEKFDVIIDSDSKLVALISKNGDLYFLKNKNNYQKDIIMKKFGKTKSYQIADYCSNCLNFENELKNIFKDSDILENFVELNNKYKVINHNYKIYLNDF